MSADITHSTNFTGFCGVGAPNGLGLAFAFEESGKPTLWVFYVDLADFSQGTGSDLVLGLFNHGVTGVGVGQTEESFGVFHRCFDGMGLLHRSTEGLVEHNMVSCFERRDGG